MNLKSSDGDDMHRCSKLWSRSSWSSRCGGKVPGTRCAAGGEDVITFARLSNHQISRIENIWRIWDDCQRNGDNIRPGMRGRQSWSLKQNNVCFGQKWRRFCLVRGKTKFDYLLFTSTTTDLSRKRGKVQILLSEKDSNKTWQSIHIYIKHRHWRNAKT